MKALNVSDLYKNYENLEVLKGLSLSVDQGEVYALMGPNGSGKSTLTSIIACTMPFNKGTVEILGLDISKEKNNVKKLIGYVPQEKFTSPLMTGEENLLYFIQLSGVPKREALKLTKVLLRKMGLESDAKRRVATYSGGMRKKLEVATALLPDVKLLILDEPTTGLDPATRRKFFSILHDIRKDNISIFYVTHIGEDAEAASKVGLIDDGIIIVEDTPNKLKKMTKYNIISIETQEKNNSIIGTIKDLSNNGNILETRDGYKIYCDEPESIIEVLKKDLASIGCRVTHTDILTPSLEDVFFSLTNKEMR